MPLQHAVGKSQRSANVRPRLRAPGGSCHNKCPARHGVAEVVRAHAGQVAHMPALQARGGGGSVAVFPVHLGTERGRNAPAATRRHRCGTRCECPCLNRPSEASTRDVSTRNVHGTAPSQEPLRLGWTPLLRGRPSRRMRPAARLARARGAQQAEQQVCHCPVVANARAPVAPFASHAALPGRLPCTHTEPARASRGVRFRPCIDIHQGKVKQIVGSTLTDAGDRCGHARGRTWG